MSQLDLIVRSLHERTCASVAYSTSTEQDSSLCVQQMARDVLDSAHQLQCRNVWVFCAQLAPVRSAWMDSLSVVDGPVSSESSTTPLQVTLLDSEKSLAKEMVKATAKRTHTDHQLCVYVIAYSVCGLLAQKGKPTVHWERFLRVQQTRVPQLVVLHDLHLLSASSQRAQLLGSMVLRSVAGNSRVLCLFSGSSDGKQRDWSVYLERILPSDVELSVDVQSLSGSYVVASASADDPAEMSGSGDDRQKFRVMNKEFRILPSDQMHCYIHENPEYFWAYHREFERKRAAWDIDPAHAIAHFIACRMVEDQAEVAERFCLCDYGAGETLPFEFRFFEALHSASTAVSEESPLPAHRKRLDISLYTFDHLVNSDIVGNLQRSGSSQHLHPYGLRLSCAAADVADTESVLQHIHEAPRPDRYWGIFCLAMSGRNLGHYFRTALEAAVSTAGLEASTILVCEATFRCVGQDVPSRLCSWLSTVVSTTEAAQDGKRGNGSDLISVEDVTTQVNEQFWTANPDRHRVLNPRPSYSYFLIRFHSRCVLADRDSSTWNVEATRFFAEYPE